MYGSLNRFKACIILLTFRIGLFRLAVFNSGICTPSRSVNKTVNMHALNFYGLLFQMQAVDFNPFTWDNSSNKVKSSVISLELKSGNAKRINVSNLNNDIEIIIPISSPPQNSSNGTEHYFLKPNQMSVRSYYAELADVPVSLTFGVAQEGIHVELYIKFGRRPSASDSDHNFTFTSTRTCENKTDDEPSCFLKDTSFAVVPSKPGFLYVGLSFQGAKNKTEHSRKRRACFGHRRERRSCVGVKDPPPKGVTTTVVPQYDPNTDVNYTFTITQSSCLYWSEDKEKWTSDGCKVTCDFYEIPCNRPCHPVTFQWFPYKFN